MERLWQFARRSWRRWLWGITLLALTNASAMVIPQLFRMAIDGIQNDAELTDLRGIALLMILVAFGGAAFRSLSRIHIFFAARDVEKDLRCAYYEHLATQSPEFYENHPVGDLMSRATNDLTQVRLMLGPGVLNVVNTSIAYGIAIPLMAAISWKLTLLTLAVYPPSLFLMRFLARKLFFKTREQQQQLGQISNLIQENLAGAHVVRAFNQEDRQAAAFDVLNERYYTASLNLVVIRAWLFRAIMVIGNVGVMLAVFFGSLDALAGRVTIGELVALVEYMALLSWPTFALGWVLSTIQRGRASMSRLNEVFEISPTITSGAGEPDRDSPSMSVAELTVGYGDDGDVLHDVSFEVPAGTTLGIVGSVGSGKTTLVRALMRLIDLPDGRVHLGGTDVKEWPLDDLRAQFGYTPQLHVLFSKSLAENVRFGRPEASDDEVRRALAAAAFDPEQQGLPQGLATPIGERGIALSGGQKQRTSLARALLLNPPILVLDDALASVDAETETRILDSLKEMRAEKTTVIIAHRISAVQHADHIIVLDQGRIIERGTHQELRQANGFYAQLVRRQEAGATDADRALERVGT
ncbi:MAG: ABC transporter ATP-binding protein [Myxococcota bacterium]